MCVCVCVGGGGCSRTLEEEVWGGVAQIPLCGLGCKKDYSKGEKQSGGGLEKTKKFIRSLPRVVQKKRMRAKVRFPHHRVDTQYVPQTGKKQNHEIL